MKTDILASPVIAQPTQFRIVDKLSSKNILFFRKIISAQLSGTAALPYGLGLNSSSYNELCRVVHDPSITRNKLAWHQDDWLPIRQRAEVYGEILTIKMEERNELVDLLCQYSDEQKAYTMEMAIIIATACLAQFHLWKSLGLQSRAQLSELMQHNFPQLHKLNHNMRWKRFFYKCLCEQGGDYICRAPSCEQCRSYAECFVS